MKSPAQLNAEIAEVLADQASRKVHWIVFDPANLAKANRSLRAGSRYLVRRVYGHPTKAWLTVLQIESPDAYADLALDVNSGSSTLRRLPRKPGNLGPGLSVEAWERIYGPLEAPR
jgi:hypothetical protein